MKNTRRNNQIDWMLHCTITAHDETTAKMGIDFISVLLRTSPRIVRRFPHLPARNGLMLAFGAGSDVFAILFILFISICADWGCGIWFAWGVWKEFADELYRSNTRRHICQKCDRTPSPRRTDVRSAGRFLNGIYLCARYERLPRSPDQLMAELLDVVTGWTVTAEPAARMMDIGFWS